MDGHHNRYGDPEFLKEVLVISGEDTARLEQERESQNGESALRAATDLVSFLRYQIFNIANLRIQ